jgi:predicted secreted protein
MALAMAAVPVAAQTGHASPANVMTLSASASSEVTQDLLTVTFTTTRDGADAAAVQRQLKQALDAALAEARAVARPGQVDVQTGAFSLYPRQSTAQGRTGGTIVGWQGRAEMIVEGRDAQAIAALAGRIQTLTVAQVRHSLSRELREKTETETTARAIARFRELAQAHAVQFGFAGFTIREVNVGSQPVFRMAESAPMLMRAAAAPDSVPLPVEPGRATVTSSVSGSVQMVK